MKKDITQKPEISSIQYNEKDEIVYFNSTKKVMKIGTGAHILLPRELVDKTVRIIYGDEQ